MRVDKTLMDINRFDDLIVNQMSNFLSSNRVIFDNADSSSFMNEVDEFTDLCNQIINLVTNEEWHQL